MLNLSDDEARSTLKEFRECKALLKDLVEWRTMFMGKDLRGEVMIDPYSKDDVLYVRMQKQIKSIQNRMHMLMNRGINRGDEGSIFGGPERRADDRGAG